MIGKVPGGWSGLLRFWAEEEEGGVANAIESNRMEMCWTARWFSKALGMNWKRWGSAYGDGEWIWASNMGIPDHAWAMISSESKNAVWRGICKREGKQPPHVYMNCIK